MPWLKWDAEFCDHPQVVGLDWRGRVYFWQLCCISKRKDFRGTVPKPYASPEYVVSQLPGVGARQMAAGKAQCEEADLTDTDDEGNVKIDGWRRRQTDPTGAERQARWRNRQKEQAVTASNALRNGVTRDSVTRNDRHRERQETETPKKDPPDGGSPDVVRELFEQWKILTGQPERVRLTSGRRSKLKARLADSTPDEIRLALEGCACSAFHMGDNDEHRKYNDITLICRSREKLEQFMGYAEAREPTAWERLGISEDAYRRGDF